MSELIIMRFWDKYRASEVLTELRARHSGGRGCMKITGSAARG